MTYDVTPRLREFPADVDIGGVRSGVEAASERVVQERLHAAEQNFLFPPSALAVQLSTARVGLTHCAESRAFLQADWPVREHTSRSRTRYQVFRDLRRRGFYLTSAGKFGGDFLVYPGEQTKVINPLPCVDRMKRVTFVRQVTLCVSTPTSSPSVCQQTSPSVCWTSSPWLVWAQT